MIKMILLTCLLLISCGKVENGKDGINGSPGLNGGNYYSYLINVNIQQIIEEPFQEVILTEGEFYQLPETFDVAIDNPYTECNLQDLDIVVETDSEALIFTFQATENRYKMEYKAGPLLKYLDTSYIRVYYRSKPETDCGDAIYRLHSGLQFSIRVFKEIDV